MSVVRIALDTLASLPSIVYGLFGFLVFVVEMKEGYSLFAGAVVLADVPSGATVVGNPARIVKAAKNG